MEIDLLETDPPYNVNISNSSGMTIANDNMDSDSFAEFLHDCFVNAWTVMRPGAAFYIWHADTNGLTFREQTKAAGLDLKQNLVWIKNRFTLGRQDYQWQHEPCLYGWKPGASHYFVDQRNLKTVIKSKGGFETLSREQLLDIVQSFETTTMFEDIPLVDDLHPTMKPIDLIIRQVKNSTKKGWNVLDLFGGSGTTLIACERLERNAFLMEFDPKYADVIIRRWEGETGKKAELIAE